MASINQKQIQGLQQKLSPQQIQMIKLLELPSMQLEQRVKQELEENPVLEEDVKEERSDEEAPKEVSMEEYFKEDDTPGYKYYVNNYSKDDKQRPLYMTGGRTLQESLEEQLDYKALSDRQRAVASYLVGSLDEDGYLRRDLESVSDDMAFTQGLDVSVKEIEEVLAVIQQLDPVGIGARNLRECLLLQMENYDEMTPSRELARKIVGSYFEDFTKKHYERLIARLSVSEEQFRDAIEEIKRLSPRPGNLFGEGVLETAPYITPDFILDYQNGQFDLRLSSYNVPDIKINKQYVDMIREMASQKEGTEDEKEAIKFVKSRLDSAKWFIAAIKQRRDTLMSTMREILNYQQEYFADGNKSLLRPMILKDIADRTGLDVSTISRVVNSKYVQTNFGIIPLKQLFSEAMQTDSGEEVSSYEIKNILSECIENEDKQKPLTDEALMQILNGMGYHIARRTVAKYREILNIPVARLRKQI